MARYNTSQRLGRHLLRQWMSPVILKQWGIDHAISGTIGPGINVGRAPRSTGAAGGAVTSASARATNWRENCNGLLNSNVGEK